MNDNFKKYGFYIIKNFISPDRSKKLSDEFIDFCNQNPSECRDDDQVKGSPSKYNFTPFLELLCEKNTEVSKIIGEPVLPTYSYARFYKKDAILEKHTDRESCEISLTIHLDGDKDWKFYIEDSNGKENKIILNPGDAILYSGTILPHWRKKFKGKSYTQVFLHYVKSNGKYKDFYFESPQLSIKNYIITITDFKCERLPGSITKYQGLNTNGQRLRDAMYVVNLEIEIYKIDGDSPGSDPYDTVNFERTIFVSDVYNI